MQEKISVVMPCYNHEDYIAQAIEGILEQSYNNYEIIIVDDNSTDSSVAIAKEYSKKHSNIRIIEHSNNLGTSRTINDGFMEASGEYIAIQSTDDISLPKRLEKQVEYFRANPDVDGVSTHIIPIDSSGKERPTFSKVRSIFNIPNISRTKMLREFFINNNFINNSSQMLRTSAIKKIGFNKPALQQYHDYEMHIRTCLFSKMDIMEEELLMYRLRDDNKNVSILSSLKKTRCFLEMNTVLDNYLNITNVNFFLEIFGEDIEKNITSTSNVCVDTIPFFLGMLAIQLTQATEKHIWGCKAVYECYNKDGIQEILYNRLGMQFKDFISIAGVL